MIAPKSRWILASLAFLCALQAGPADAQNQDEYRRFTFSFNAGTVNAGNSDSALNPLGSFGSPLNPGLSLGSSLMYGFTPEFALEARGHLNFFNVAEPELVDQVAHTSLRGVFFLNQLLGIRPFGSRLGPYFTAGAGIDVVDITDLAQSGWNVVGGLGTNIYLNEAVDFFIQYDWSGGDKLNLTRQGEKEFSSYRNLYAGLRIHIGPAGTTHPSWRLPLLRREEPTRMMADEASDRPADENARLVSELQEQNEALATLLEQMQGQNQLLESEVNMLRERISELEMMVEAEQQPQTLPQEAIYDEITPGSENPMAPAADDSSIDTSGEADARTLEPVLNDGIYPPRGHYVQLFASRGLQPALRAHTMAVQLLQNQFENAAEMVFIAERQQFHEVFVGMFSGVSPAGSVVDGVASTFGDAFIITFPRPAHLQEQYEGMQVIDVEND